MERNFVRVAGASEIPVGSMKKVNYEGVDVLIVNVNGHYYALRDNCPLLGGDFSEGTLNGEIIACQQHRAKFNVTTGKFASNVRFPSLHPKVPDVETYDVLVENGEIMIKPLTHEHAR
ncbi:Rieske 2Fe-2S domain-containing protein [Candidatus Bathyarchaeota archaeon]|nr:Rieske 2Fe-2S domain-containing protein [Candidatus Bathyarchaeota archaeon]